jgi:hypothetical protein
MAKKDKNLRYLINIENFSMLGLTGLTELTTAPATAEPVVKAQKDNQATNPSL